MKNKFIEKYNRKDSLLIIAGWPKKRETYSQGVCAVSSFTKNTLIALQKENPDRKIVVLTMQIDKKEIYEEDAMLILRCFKRDQPLSYLGLLKHIFLFNRTKDLLIEFEFSSFGNTFMTGLLVPTILVLFLMKKDINLVIHQVVSDIKGLSGHIGIPANNLRISFFNNFLKLFYFFLALPSRRVIVLEEEFKIKLSRLVGSNKIAVIPHGVDTNIKKTNKDMRKSLGIKKDEFVILYFGNLSWYKGVDFLISTLKYINKINGKKIRLVVAGGPSFTQEDKVHYQQFLKKVEKAVRSSKNVILTGFVKEKDIPPIFKTADLSVFPYRTFMSSSGPLSLALSHNKPFILSERLGLFLESNDVRHAMEYAGITKEDLLFDLNSKSLVSAIKNASATKTHQKMIKFSKALGQERSFSRIAVLYDKIISKDLEYKLNPALSSA